MPVLDVRKGDAHNQGVHSKADESIGSFLHEHCAEEDETVDGLPMFN